MKLWHQTTSRLQQIFPAVVLTSFLSLAADMTLLDTAVVDRPDAVAKAILFSS